MKRGLLVASSLACACATAGTKNGESTGAAGTSTAAASSSAPRPPRSNIVELPIGGYAVAFRLMFYTGAFDDPPGKEGLTRLTAQLMAEGGTRRLSYAELLRELYPMAAEIGAQVDKEQTVFGGVVHEDHAEAFARLLAEVIAEPRLPESDFRRIQKDLIDDIEKRLRATDDENLGKEILNLMLYEGHPYGHFNGGTVEGLRSITLEDVKAHAARVFGKKRMVTGLAGQIAPKTKETLFNALAALPDGEVRIAEVPARPKPSKMEVLIAEKPGKAVAISMGYSHEARRGHPDFSELGLVQSYLGEHRQFHGVLMNELRGKRGLNYGDYSYVESFVQEGWSRNALTNIARRRQHFEIWIRPVDPKDAVFAIRAALHFLERTVEAGLSQQNVDDIKTFLLGYTRLWEVTPERRLGHALDDHFYDTDHHLAQYRVDLGKMTAAEVNGAIGRHLVARPIKIAIVAPDAEALKAALISGAPTRKEYGAAVTPDVTEADEKIATFPLGLSAEHVRVVKSETLFVR